LVDFNPGMYGIILQEQKRMHRRKLQAPGKKEGYDIEALHGDLTQQQRDKVMQRFRDKSISY